MRKFRWPMATLFRAPVEGSKGPSEPNFSLVAPQMAEIRTCGGVWGNVQTLLGANKYSCILIPTISYPYIPIITHNRSCYYSIWCYKFAKYTYNICSSK